MANQERKHAQTPRLRPTPVDLEAVVCLDMQHQWRLVEDNRVKQGAFKGCPRRVKLCMVCGSLKAETINWRGEVMSREYKTDPVYLAESRKLHEEPNQRRKEYRKRLLGRPPKGVCTRCGLLHPGEECWDLT